MKPWERKLHEWGLLGYLVRDVIGAQQEEGFGIRQNHTMGIKDWHALIKKHFAQQEYELFVPERGWGERVAKRIAIRLDPYRSEWRAARLLGGTVAAACRKAGQPEPAPPFDRFETLLRCPDCHGAFARDAAGTLTCGSCGYTAPDEGGVYNLLPSAERNELYPGDREDVIDFCQPSHERHLLEGWYDIEGVFGNKYRWIGAQASAWLKRVNEGPQRLRIRGHAPERGEPIRIDVTVNGTRLPQFTINRPGLFLLESDVPDAPEYRLDIAASPTWKTPKDDRTLSVNLSRIRLTPRD